MQLSWLRDRLGARLHGAAVPGRRSRPAPRGAPDVRPDRAHRGLAPARDAARPLGAADRRGAVRGAARRAAAARRSRRGRSSRSPPGCSRPGSRPQAGRWCRACRRWAAGRRRARPAAHRAAHVRLRLAAGPYLDDRCRRCLVMRGGPGTRATRLPSTRASAPAELAELGAAPSAAATADRSAGHECGAAEEPRRAAADRSPTCA